MAWDEDRFERFVDATISMAKGRLPGYGRLHVVLPYPPREELVCIEALRSLPARLEPAGLVTTVVPIAPLVARAVERYSRRELHTADEYRRLQSDLSSPHVGVATRAAAACADRVRETLTPETVLVVCRLGALYPFGHVSTFLEALYRAGIHGTVAVAYPGTAEGTSLRFLGLLDPTGGYRGHVVT